MAIVPDVLTDAWSNGTATALSISATLSRRAGKPLPWRYLADTSVLTDPDGTVMDKSRILNDLKSGDLKFQSSKAGRSLFRTEDLCELAEQIQALGKEDLRTKLPGVAQTQIAMLARTEGGRAETAFTRARGEPWGSTGMNGRRAKTDVFGPPTARWTACWMQIYSFARQISPVISDG